MHNEICLNAPNVEYVRIMVEIRSKGSSQNNVLGHRGCLDHIKICVDAKGMNYHILQG